MFSNIEITINLDDAINNISFVKGVFYQDENNENQLLVPHFTGDFWCCDCTIYDKKTMETNGDSYPILKKQLGNAVNYIY